MLRLIVLLLILLNGTYFAWGQGWLLIFGTGPVQQREPQRLLQQVNPDAIELVGSKDAAPVVVATPVQLLCLQTAAMDEAQATAVRGIVQAALPAGAWTLDAQATPERWIIYMGKYANEAELDKKRAQLASLKLTFEPLVKPELAPGLSLGAFATQEAAMAAMEALALRGVRTARVLQEAVSRHVYRLRLPALDESMQKQLPMIKAALNGKPLENCPAPVRP